MMKAAAVGVALHLMTTNAWGAGDGKRTPPAHCLNVNSKDDVETVQTPAFLEILLHPEKFDGCLIRIGAYVRYNYPYSRLYASAQDKASGGMFFGSLRLSFRGRTAKVDFDEFREKTSKGYVIATGRFR